MGKMILRPCHLVGPRPGCQRIKNVSPTPQEAVGTAHVGTGGAHTLPDRVSLLHTYNIGLFALFRPFDLKIAVKSKPYAAFFHAP